MRIADKGDDKYRYWMRVEWDAELFQAREGTILWVMLNPSTASARSGPDPTTRRVVDFSRREGFTRCEVVNLFAFRSPEPQDLLDAIDPVGPKNDDAIAHAAAGAAVIVVGWGTQSPATLARRIEGRARELRRFLPRSAELVCLGTCEDGNPRHPLYLAGKTPLEPWRAPP